MCAGHLDGKHNATVYMRFYEGNLKAWEKRNRKTNSLYTDVGGNKPFGTCRRN